MNPKAIATAGLFAALNICTLSAHAEAKVTPQTYSYGTQLDISKVLSLTEDNAPQCGIVNAQMTYLDSHNQIHVLDYRKVAENCSSEN
ncbi:DUF2790 domain-containing protein [Pseudomonas sp. S9]|uniref:DUF2790 domain-containing protein n=1 Tax=Pseudomonas sp. S9 TaxID=686578 RepID=UPI00025567B0|nr:DUF2790 domain-containing protein [Pseudomonas sp. S9]